jgi:hypothetical protein
MTSCLFYSDTVRNKIALKIIKNVDKYREAAKLEINVLDKVNGLDRYGDKYVITAVIISGRNCTRQLIEKYLKKK